jgi:hypothetical protein
VIERANEEENIDEYLENGRKNSDNSNEQI